MSDNLPVLSSPFPTEFAPVERYMHMLGGGYAYEFHFPNGFGASVIPVHNWELAVLKDEDGVWPLCYTTVVADDVLPGLSEQDVAETLAVIARLDSHGRLPGLVIEDGE